MLSYAEETCICSMKELHKNKANSIQFLSTMENLKVGYPHCASRLMVTPGNGRHNTVFKCLIKSHVSAFLFYVLYCMYWADDDLHG